MVLTAHETIPGNQNHRLYIYFFLIMLTLYKIFIGLRPSCLEYLVYEKYLALFDYLDTESPHLAAV